MRLVTASVTGLLALLAAGPVWGQEPQAAEREREHVVRRGDTLWDLAGRYLGNPFQWPRIHEVNTRIVADPHWIYPNQVLVIPGLWERVAMVPGAPGDPTLDPYADPYADPVRTVFFPGPAARPTDRPTVLMEPLANRVPVKPGEFYRAEFLAQAAALPVVGRVVQSTRELDRMASLAQTAQPRDDLYVGYAQAQPPAVGDRFLVVEVGRPIPGARADARLVDPRAVVRVVALETEVMRVHVEEQFGRVVRDQVLLPLEFYPDFVINAAEPVPGDFDLQGRLLEFVHEDLLPGKLARAFIDQGRAEGVQVGDVFEAFLPPRRAVEADALGRATGEMLPAEAIAMLRVVRVTDLGATVVVDELTKPELHAGIPVRRVRKMP
jgi:hypothetical protein